VTSELTGEELWNLAKLGYAPHQLVMATSVYSLGVAAGIGTMFASMSRGELPQVTQLIYKARENCLELIRREAQAIGAERVIGNKLIIRELMPGLIEVVAIGTAIRPAANMVPTTPNLITQAVIVDRDSLDLSATMPAMGAAYAARMPMRGGSSALGCLIAGGMMVLTIGGSIIAMLLNHQ